MEHMMGLAPDINVLEAMEIFKNFPDEDLRPYLRDPKLAAVAAGEIDRRLNVRRDFESRQQQNQGTVVEQLQAMLLSPPQQMPPQQMPPQEMLAQQMLDQQIAAQQPPNVPQGLPALMASGGPVAFQQGGGILDKLNSFFRQVTSFGSPSWEMVDQKSRPLSTQTSSSPLELSPFGNQVISDRIATADARKEKKEADEKQQKALLELIRQRLAPQTTTTTQSNSGKPAKLPTLPAVPTIEATAPLDPRALRASAEEEEAYLKNKFPDTVSPLAEALAREAGQQVSPEEQRRRAFMQAGIRGLGYQGRDFGGGLAGMFEGYENTKNSIESANKEARTNAAKARLAAEQYKDALRRKDYESARVYALKVEEFRQAAVDSQNKAKLANYGLQVKDFGAKLDLYNAQNKGSAQQKPPSIRDLLALDRFNFDVNKEVNERAKPEIDALKAKYNKDAAKWFSDTPKNWEQNPEYRAKFEAEAKAIRDRIRAELGVSSGSAAKPIKLTPEMLLDILKVGSGK